MTNLPLYQIDAFSSKLFSGNPAAVVPLPEFLPDNTMQSIAAENNLSETAFVVVRGPGVFGIRWFTPTAEVRLCGHATLAAAHVLYQSSGKTLEQLTFQTERAGSITVRPLANGTYQMDFPADAPHKTKKPANLLSILGVKKVDGVYRGKDDLLVIIKSKKQLQRLEVDFQAMAKLTKYRGVIVSAPGKKFDFVSRCFYPQTGIDEDPVTGSAHTLLTPYWSSRLGRNKLSAKQISGRGGEIRCQLKGKTVRLTGRAATYLSGQINLENEEEF
ncbi:PhzF family phenazine biosynthesis protein [Lewinella sp. 4G2]|uniref:PhzF family phenazine biosynthesis protein n=1 Tax=Lewinella sp. 4G2 TaxID=1803372 RepID=UPI0007B4BF96|nr:PhzF family phenazine biosynthesis protein [Lewinella sp. 4G2]OAV46039.1 hypothetical protein A3850_017375 [Lewinella sp. 4G2]